MRRSAAPHTDGRLAIAVVKVLAIAFPHRVIIGGGMPILPHIGAATISAADLAGE